MDETDYFRLRVREQARTFEVYRKPEGDSYGASMSSQGQRDVAIFDAVASSMTPLEGFDDEVALAGLAVPGGSPDIQVGDELRLASDTTQRYDVREKAGVPNNLDPRLWELGLERANAST